MWKNLGFSQNPIFELEIDDFSNSRINFHEDNEIRRAFGPFATAGKTNEGKIEGKTEGKIEGKTNDGKNGGKIEGKNGGKISEGKTNEGKIEGKIVLLFRAQKFGPELNRKMKRK